VEGHANPYIDGDGETDGLIAALRVVDDRVEAEQELQRLARFDTLTGLANRAETLARFDTLISAPRRAGRHLGILFCDVDHFKAVNDTWGHTTGDVVLATIGTRISECVRAGDTVGRIGGDEILVLMPAVRSLEESATIAERIRMRAAEPIYAGEMVVQVSLSIGATVARPDETVLSVLARADTAMYRAKAAGRDAVTRI
jgi:diguanylate cyclase (GGDEF)-like protein